MLKDIHSMKIHAEGLGKLKKEEEKPEPETPAEPKPEDPKEEPKEPEKPEEPKEEELPEANRGEDVFVRDGKYFVKRFDENGNAVEIFVKKSS